MKRRASPSTRALQAALRKEADDIDLETATLKDFYTKIPQIKAFLHEVHRLYGVPGKLISSDDERSEH